MTNGEAVLKGVSRCVYHFLNIKLKRQDKQAFSTFFKAYLHDNHKIKHFPEGKNIVVDNIGDK